MARMKIEFLHQYRKTHPLTPRDRLVAYLPRYAGIASKLAPLLNLRNRVPVLASLGERLTGLSAKRKLPAWNSRPYRAASPAGSGTEVVLFVDTFNRWFEPENARAAERVLRRAGYRPAEATPEGERPLCCGRTFLATGLIAEAQAEALRMLAALKPHLDRGTPIVGLEPSCLLTLRDEYLGLLPGEHSKVLASRAKLFEEFIADESAAGRLKLAPGRHAPAKVLLHGHCHQKAFNTLGASVAALKSVPGIAVETFESTCCGMAGAFGYEAEHHDVSLKIGELGVLPKMRAADAATVLAASGISCRHQIRDGAGREALHVARILDQATAD
jgi:Fe-S oxidoreductase